MVDGLSRKLHCVSFCPFPPNQSRGWCDGVTGVTAQGTCVYASGDCYTGEWVKDARTGYGKMVYGGGDEYEGQWVGGRRDGKGTGAYANGDRYQVRVGAFFNVRRCRGGCLGK